MLKRRVIPTLLLKGVGLVKGKSFDSWRRVGTLLPAIRVYQTRDVDEIVLLDISATEEGRGPDLAAVKDAALECAVPLTAGGGVRSLEEVKNLLRAGADKVLINSAAYDDPALIRAASRTFGAQCVVAGIDVRGVGNEATCVGRRGTRDEGITPRDHARRLEELGAGELLLTSVERDGTMAGYDVDTLREVAAAVTIPVIASGGAGSYEHMHDALVRGGASAVAAASIFHYTELTPLGAKAYLAARGIPVRSTSTR